MTVELHVRALMRIGEQSINFNNGKTLWHLSKGNAGSTVRQLSLSNTHVRLLPSANVSPERGTGERTCDDSEVNDNAGIRIMEALFMRCMTFEPVHRRCFQIKSMSS